MKKLEDYLKENIERGTVEHVIRTRLNADGKPEFYIQPLTADGNAHDFVVEGNYLIPKNNTRSTGTLIARMSVNGYKYTDTR